MTEGEFSSAVTPDGDWPGLRIDSSRAGLAQVESVCTDHGAVSITLQAPNDVDAHLPVNPDLDIVEPPPGAAPVWQQVAISALFENARCRDACERALAAAHISSQRFALDAADWVNAWRQHATRWTFANGLRLEPVKEPMDKPGASAFESTSGDHAPPPRQVWLSPGLAFGTGAHPTTWLCLDWIDGADLNGARVLDIGSGSGILSLAALACGASHVVAVDIDPQARQATEENARINHMEQRLEMAHKLDAVEGKFDLILANILLAPLLAMAEGIAALCHAGSAIVLSGLLASQQHDVVAAYQPWFESFDLAQRDGWLRLSGQCRP